MTELEFKTLRQVVNEASKDHKDHLFNKQQVQELGSTLFSLASISLLAYFVVVVL